MRILDGGIAFFDSGIGGLTVLNDFLNYYTQLKRTENGLSDIKTVYYYGDNFRAPYGNLNETQIFSYVEEAFAEFDQLQVQAVVIACNTATAICIEELRRKYPFPIIGTEPAVLQAAKEGGEILVLATGATSNSTRLKSLCEKAEKFYPNSTIKVYPCEHLAELIERENGQFDFQFSKILPKATPNAVVLGCTHYIYIKEKIQNYYQCKVFDGNEGVAKRLTQILCENVNFSNFKEKNEKIKPPLTTTPFLPTFSLDNTKICFIGGGKMVNKTKYEQMFALK